MFVVVVSLVPHSMTIVDGWIEFVVVVDDDEDDLVVVFVVSWYSYLMTTTKTMNCNHCCVVRLSNQ